MEFYAERFRTIFREIGENITKPGSQVGGMAEQVAEWLRQRFGRFGWVRKRGPAREVGAGRSAGRFAGPRRPSGSACSQLRAS